ncbi:hypothetical protein BS78_08G169700 [Paspalum vaginatum]|nr:hypothetical protein BS78_08G169700 [Paspalum vaginatum]
MKKKKSLGCSSKTLPTSPTAAVVQAILFVARPPRVSYICVCYRRHRPGQPQAVDEPFEEEEDLQKRMIPTEPEVVATDLRITVGRHPHKSDGWYAYLPGVPLLTRLDPPPYGGFMFHPSSVGVVSTDSSKMVDVESSPGFQLLPTFDDGEGRTLPPFMGLQVAQPVLGLDDSSDDSTVCCFMARYLGDAWVMDVDMRNNRLRGVDEFGAYDRYYRVGIGYKQSRISRYLKTRAPAAARTSQQMAVW